MFSIILLPAVLIGALGLVFGVVLAIAARFFSVEIDPKIEAIVAILPGANCGACGQPGCGGYAEAVVSSGVATNLCAPGGATVANQIAEILGTTAGETIKKVAVIHCNSGGYNNTNIRYEYDGIKNCKAATMIAHGPNACVYGCVYQNDCIVACPFGAIRLDENGIKTIDYDLCSGCGSCAKVCPRKLIEIVPISNKVHVLCSSLDRGQISRNNCGASTACIGCSLCVKTCTASAIKLENHLARIDYSLCTSCGDCVKKCPSKAIVAPRR